MAVKICLGYMALLLLSACAAPVNVPDRLPEARPVRNLDPNTACEVVLNIPQNHIAIERQIPTIAGAAASGIRQIVQLANPAILVLASPNAPSSIQKAVALPGPKTANIVLTLDRNGTGFSRFFRDLFDKMREGKEMLSAWAELAPQHPAANAPHNPQTVLLSEAGKLALPR